MNRSRFSTLRWRIRLAILIIVLGVGGYYGYWATLGYRFKTVAEGKVYQSAEMPPEVLRRKVRDLGVHSVIHLCNEDPAHVHAEGAALEKEGVRHFHVPSTQVPDAETVAAVLAILDRPENYPVLVHCEHGEGRSVLMAALYRIEYEGWSNEKALEATRLIRWGSSFADGTGKGEYLRHYKPRKKAAVPAR